MSVGQATEALGGLGFAAVTRDTFSDDVAPSALVGTDPDAGTRVPRGDTVAVLVSAGRPQVPEEGADRTVEAASGRLRGTSPEPSGGPARHSGSVAEARVVP